MTVTWRQQTCAKKLLFCLLITSNILADLTLGDHGAQASPKEMHKGGFLHFQQIFEENLVINLDPGKCMYLYSYVQSWTKVSGQPRKNSITVGKKKEKRFIEK